MQFSLLNSSNPQKGTTKKVPPPRFMDTYPPPFFTAHVDVFHGEIVPLSSVSFSSFRFDKLAS